LVSPDFIELVVVRCFRALFFGLSAIVSAHFPHLRDELLHVRFG
jgi:hypothetical protein